MRIIYERTTSLRRYVKCSRPESPELNSCIMQIARRRIGAGALHLYGPIPLLRSGILVRETAAALDTDDLQACTVVVDINKCRIYRASRINPYVKTNDSSWIDRPQSLWGAHIDLSRRCQRTAYEVRSGNSYQ